MRGEAATGIAALRRELVAALTVVSVSLPICLATGLLLYGPLGTDYYPAGVSASLYGFIVGGAVAALTARSSFVISSPRASTALVQASLLASMAAGAAIRGGPVVVVTATTLCVLLAGLWQLLFGLLGIARVIKFTPHPVLAGFINGIALLIIMSQVKSLLERPSALAFAAALAALVLFLGKWQRRIPAGLAGLVLGAAAFHLAGRWLPGIDLGPLLGPFALPIPPHPPLADLLDARTRAAVAPMLAQVTLTSLAVAVVATLESMLSLRVAQTMAPDAVAPARDLYAQGLGNCAAALAGGMAITASPLQSTAAYRAGGRSRVVGLTAIVLVATLVIVAPALFAAVPVAVLAGLLVATGVLLFDRWSLRLVRELARAEALPRRRRALGDLAVVALVTALTAAVSVVAGIVAGSLLAGLTFIVNMSRPVIRRQHRCDELASKRVRPAADAAILRRVGARARVLELEGVLFFGNADDLSRVVRDLFTQCDSVVLDLRAISDIDASGANILQGMVHGSPIGGKRLLFCNVPAALREVVGALAANEAAPPVSSDLDTLLEWLEERSLRDHVGERGRGEVLTLWAHPLLEGLDAAERDAVEARLVHRRFAAGTTLCAQGEPADRMWLLTRGSVSVRVRATDREAGLRVSSCAAGTAVGEMALLQFGVRSASLLADEEVEAYELSCESFEWLSRACPQAAAKLLKNIATELSRRLRERTEDLRHALT